MEYVSIVREFKGNKGFVQFLIMTLMLELSYRAKEICGSVRMYEFSKFIKVKARG